MNDDGLVKSKLFRLESLVWNDDVPTADCLPLCETSTGMSELGTLITDDMRVCRSIHHEVPRVELAPLPLAPLVPSGPHGRHRLNPIAQ